MCGIGGWFSRSVSLDDGAARLHALNAVQKHRGPDGDSILQLDHVGMAHRRLAVIDLATGDQPMWSADGRWVIVFNGEIFNYRELRAFYQARGERFVSQSDTEVVIAAYRHEGMTGLGRLRGMFAFALWDTETRSAVLVRDLLGIKPLFVSESEGELFFASEGKGVLALTRAQPELDTGALHLLLNFRYVPGEASLLRGLRQLEPGECLVWRTDGFHSSSKLKPSELAGDDDLEAVLADSVRVHLTADVPVGCYLSGGIDSGLIAALAATLHADIPTFTLAVGDDPAEARNAARTAQILRLDNAQSEVGEDEVQRLPQMLWHLETPKVNAIQLFRLAEVARGQVKVTLSGLGGDELFAGYNAHRILHAYTRLPAGAVRATAKVLGHLLNATVPYTENVRALEMAEAAGDWPLVYALLRNVWDRPRLRTWLYGPRMLDVGLPDAVGVVRERWPTGHAPVPAMLRFEWENKMVNDLLWQEDRASMAVGLEVRVPYVDLNVRAAVDQLGPARLGKASLREVARKYLPDEVLSRPKSGFQLDAPSFFDTRLRGLANIWLAPDRVREYGIFNPATVESLLRLPVRRRYRWHFFMLYMMIQTHMFVELFERGAENLSDALSHVA